MTLNVNIAPPVETAALDEAHIGDIRGAFGAIRVDDVAPRRDWRRKLQTLLAIVGRPDRHGRRQ